LRNRLSHSNGWKQPQAAGKTVRRLIESLETANAIMSGGAGQNAFPPFTIHDAGGELLHANETAAAWLGTDASNMRGKGYLDHIHVQDRVAAARALRSHSGRVTEDSVEFRPLPKPSSKLDGAGPVPTWIEAKIRHISMDGSAYVVAMMHDTSGVHELNHALERVREESEKTSVAKSRFFANVSHELRTPLNAILGFSELLTSPVMAGIDDDKRNEYADLIHESASHLLAVLNDILDMSKIESATTTFCRRPSILRPALKAQLRSCAARLTCAVSTSRCTASATCRKSSPTSGQSARS